MSDAILSVQQLSVQFRDKVVLDQISFSVSPGDYVSLIGPNGAGKSTLLQCLCGLIQPAKGKVFLDGVPLSEQTPRQRARCVSYVPQLMQQPMGLTVGEFVLTARYAHMQSLLQDYSLEDQAVADRCIGQAGLSSLTSRLMDTLSGGERQLAFIAAALAQQTPLLLLDEPFAFLDYTHIKAVCDLIRREQQNRSLTVVAVHHNVEMAHRLSDSILALKQGRALFFGTEEAMETDRVLERLFDVPFIYSTHQKQGRFVRADMGF